MYSKFLGREEKLIWRDLVFYGGLDSPLETMLQNWQRMESLPTPFLKTAQGKLPPNVTFPVFPILIIILLFLTFLTPIIFSKLLLSLSGPQVFH